MILSDVCPTEERGTAQARGRRANWEAGVQVCSDYISNQSGGRRRQIEEETAGFTVKLKVPLGVCWRWETWVQR